jgi:hypothetical protein
MLIINDFNKMILTSKFTANIKKIDTLRRLLTLALLCTLLAACAGMSEAARPPSPEVQRLINKYHIDKYTLDVALMPRWTATPSVPVRRGQGQMYRLPQEHVSLEAFIFDVYYAPGQGMFWVKRTSPAASLEEIYGPIRLSDLP